MQKNIPFKLGSDPELFLRHRQSKELRSAIPIIPEGKHGPRPLDDLGNAVLHDNVLIEFNTAPSENEEHFVRNIGAVLKHIDELVAKSETEIHLQASANFPSAELENPEAQAFGCDPDFDAYALTRNEMDADAAANTFRSAGGHLHIGFLKEEGDVYELLSDPYGKVRVVKALDIFVGLISVFLEMDETAPARRSLYGKAGAHRAKDYGVEYRASSPWWLASPEHTKLVYQLSSAALQNCLEEDAFEQLINSLGGEDTLQQVINDSEKDHARELYETHVQPLLSTETHELIDALYGKEVNFRESWQLS